MANIINGYTFDSQPTKEETEQFEYVAFDYFAVNPDYLNNSFVSYCGIYYSEKGELSGIYVANNQVEQY